MATHSSVLAWRTPGTGESGGLPSLGLHRVGHDWSNLAAAAAVHDRHQSIISFPIMSCESHSVASDSLRPHGLRSPCNSPGQDTRVGGLSLLQGIFPTQGSNPSLPHCRQVLYQLSHKGSPIFFLTQAKFRKPGKNFTNFMELPTCFYVMSILSSFLMSLSP